MSGAHFTINQAVNPIPVGDEDIARTDLWQNRVVHLVAESDDGQTEFQWTILSWPAGHAESQPTAATTADATYTPTLPGSYRIQLIVDDGGDVAANHKEFIFAVTRNVDGLFIDEAIREPAYGEDAGDDNSEDNDRGWALAYEHVLPHLYPMVVDFIRLRLRVSYRFPHVRLLRHTVGADTGGGHFYWDAGSTVADDNINVAQPGFGTGAAMATGRWVRSRIVVDGADGADGADGTNGDPGAAGDFGGALTFQYQYSTTTADADPGAGFLRFNNATLSAATQLYADLLDNLGNTVTNVLDSFSLDGTNMHLRVMKKGSPTDFAVYLVTARTTAAGYRKFTLTYLDSGGSLANNDIVLAHWDQDGTDGGGGAEPDLQTYTTGSSTWTNPGAEYNITVISNWGAGGGGCSGAGGDGSTSNTLGGPGGGGGSFDQIIVPTSMLGGTEAYSIGTGGAGGAGNTFDAVSNPGADGGTTTFGLWSQACGGMGGTVASNGKAGAGGGVLAVGSGETGGGGNVVAYYGTGYEGAGVATGSAAPGKAAVYGGGAGGNISTASATGGAGGRSIHGGGGGGAGGNSGGTGNPSLGGGAGGGAGVGSLTGGGGAGGASVGTGVDGLPGATPTATPGRGGGGGGGGSGSNGSGALRLGGAGADGAAPGGGGGGGGGANSGGSAGRGAEGGDGANGRLDIHSI